MASNRPTLGDVARSAGVARSTVSKVLRRYPGVAESTRIRVMAAVDRIGYRPDPLVSTLMAQIHPRRRRTDMSPVIALIHGWPTPWSRRPPYRRFARGVTEMVEELGFELQEVALAPSPPDRTATLRSLRARGVQALLFAQAPDGFALPDLDLEAFSLVAIGPSLAAPRIHRVSPDHYQAVRLACRKTREAGLQRPGLIVTNSHHRRLSGIWRSAFLGMADTTDANPIPPLTIADDSTDRWSRIGSWFERHRPDAILIHADTHRSLCGRIPDSDIHHRFAGVPSLLLGAQPGKGHRGIDFNSEAVGGEAVRMLVSQLHLNQRGIPQSPRTILVEPSWVEDSSS